MAYSPTDRSTNEDFSLSLITQILDLLSKLSDKFESGESEAWQWIAQHSTNPVIVELLQESTLMTLRVVDAIGRLQPVNGITISEQFHIPKGTVSKITRRLLAQQLISTESLPNNKKEILFRLTPLGTDLFHVHRAFDEHMERGFMQFLHRYDAAQLQFLVQILQNTADTSFLELGLQAAKSDN